MEGNKGGWDIVALKRERERSRKLGREEEKVFRKLDQATWSALRLHKGVKMRCTYDAVPSLSISNDASAAIILI